MGDLRRGGVGPRRYRGHRHAPAAAGRAATGHHALQRHPGQPARVLRGRSGRVPRAALQRRHRGVRVLHAQQDGRQRALGGRDRAVQDRARAVPVEVLRPAGQGEPLPVPAERAVPDHRQGLQPGDDQRPEPVGRRGRRHLQSGQLRRDEAVQGRSRTGEDLCTVAGRARRDAGASGPVAGSRVQLHAGLAAAQRQRGGHRARAVHRAGQGLGRRVPTGPRTHRRLHRHDPGHHLRQARPRSRPRADGPLRDPGDLAAARAQRRPVPGQRLPGQGAVLVRARLAVGAVRGLDRDLPPAGLRHRRKPGHRRPHPDAGTHPWRESDRAPARLRGLDQGFPVLPAAVHAHPGARRPRLRQRPGTQGGDARQTRLAAGAPRLPEVVAAAALRTRPRQRRGELLLPDPADQPRRR